METEQTWESWFCLHHPHQNSNSLDFFKPYNFFPLILNMEAKKQQHTELEAEIRSLFKMKKDFIPSVFRLHDDELLCKCNHYTQCGKDDVADFIGKQFMDVCRPGRGGYCSRVVFMNDDGTIREVVTSCLSREQLLPRELPFVCQNSTTKQWNKIVNCCKNEAFCNDIEFPIELGQVETFSGTWALLLLLLSLVVALLCVVGFVVVCWRRRIWHKNKTRAVEQPMVNNDNESECSSRMPKQMVEATFSTGSGAGVPLLEERTICRQITLKTRIGKGRFGDVQLGEWRGEKVAVKIFLSVDEASFKRETQIYQECMLRHPHVLRWITSDTKDVGSSTELWLVTDYCQHGSLLDYLEKRAMTIQQSLLFIRSIASGLDYLHTSLHFYKPAVAHRDLKPGNILIKDDWTCCIADLGMCIFSDGKTIDRPEGGDRGGTARYLAPEFLNNSYNRELFHAYSQMDIYALALVIWEICRRVEIDNLVTASTYQVPYYEFVQREPSPDQMKQIVCDAGIRPTIPEQWSTSSVLTELTRIIEESWSAIPGSRLSALNIRRTIDERMCSEQREQQSETVKNCP